LKRTLCILLICLLTLLSLSGCSKNETVNVTGQEAGSFEPETTAVAGGLTQAIAAQESQTDGDAASAPVVDPVVDPVAADQPAADAQQPVVDATLAPAATEAPVAKPVNNSHSSIDGYSTIGNVGLEFSFSYPANWNNMPGRSTLCYVQPMEEGVTYPARVAVTMKKLPHRGTEAKVREQFASYFEHLQSQYDEETFEANMTLNYATPFMGRTAMSTTYLAYDGDQEIMGYVITTYFERYMYVFHFLCAYEDYEDFWPALQFMRDSVKTELTFDD